MGSCGYHRLSCIRIGFGLLFFGATVAFAVAVHSNAVLARARATCPVTLPRAGATPPPVLGIRPSDPKPVPYVEDWYGNGVLWVMLPPGGVLPAYRQPSGLYTKFPWFRVQPGSLHVTGERLDGPTGDFSASVGTVDAYGARGFDPSGLTWPSPGCWRVIGTVIGHGSLTITMQVAVPT